MSKYPEWQAKAREAAEKAIKQREETLQAVEDHRHKQMASILSKTLNRAGIVLSTEPTTEIADQDGWIFFLYEDTGDYMLSIQKKEGDRHTSSSLVVAPCKTPLERIPDEYNEEFAARVGETILKVEDSLQNFPMEFPTEVDYASVPDPTPQEKLLAFIQDMIDRALDDRGIVM